MFVMFASRTMDIVLLIVCSTFLSEFYAANGAVAILDYDRPYKIEQLENKIKDQLYSMPNNIRDDKYPTSSNRITDDKQSFTYQISDLPEINPGNQAPTFAVKPNDPRFYQSDFSSKLVGPQNPIQQHGYYKKDNIKNSNEVQDEYAYGSNGEYVSSKVTTENSTTNEVSMELPKTNFMNLSLLTSSMFSPDDYYFFAKVAGFGLAFLVVLIISSIAYYRIKKNNKAAADIEYPAYGVTGPNKDISPTGDRRLAQSAQMYHYQHQKQQIIAMETNNSVKESRRGSVTDPDSDDDNEEGDYTVYECPGLAPAGEMEVKNPLFLDDNTPASPHANTSKDNTISENGIIPKVPVP